jgi:VCBS repeat-containing protein
LSPEADLLFYGCDLAASADGRSLLTTIGNWANADVAASTDSTGYQSFGGDWVLEFNTGHVETLVVAGADVQRDWMGLMAVSVDNVSTGTTTDSSINISHATSGTDRLMLIGVSIVRRGSAPSVDSITYNGSSASLVGVQEGSSAQEFVEIWQLVAPDTGTHDVVVNLAGGVDAATVGVMTFNGVDQTTPLGSFASASGLSAFPSVNVLSAPGEQVFDVVAVKNSRDLNFAPAAGQTEHWDLNAGRHTNGAGSSEAGAASVTMSWTLSASDRWAIGAVSIKPLPNSPPTDIAICASSVDENIDTAGGYTVGTLTATDPDTDETFTYAIAGGADASKFTIAGAGSDELTLDDGVLDFETKLSYAVTVRVTDSGGLTYDETLTIGVNDVNEAPSMTLTNLVSSVPEDADTTSGIRAADIVVTDDALGNETLSLSGVDASLFQIVGNQLQLKPGASLDFETNPDLHVTVEVDDPAIPGSADDSVAFTLSITDVNDNAPVIPPRQSFPVAEHVSNGLNAGTITVGEVDTMSILQGWSIAGGNIDGAETTDIVERKAVSPTAEVLGLALGEDWNSGRIRDNERVEPDSRIAEKEGLRAGRGSEPSEPVEHHRKRSRAALKSLQVATGSGFTLNSLWDRLDDMQSDMLREKGSREMIRSLVVGTTALATTGLTVGYTVRAVRAGSFTVSMLSSLPAWADFDPIPILDEFDASRRASRQEEDEETLLSMVSG